MPISDFLLPELDHEIKKTHTALERVPARQKEFAPHAKSMPLGKLAPHVAQLPQLRCTVLTTPELDFSKGSNHAAAVRVFRSTGESLRRRRGQGSRRSTSDAR